MPNTRRARRERPNLGWREWVGLPELGVPCIKAKLDTGARTSALHAEEVQILPPPRGAPAGTLARVSFRVPIDRGARARYVHAEADLVDDDRWVRSSNGTQERRPVILTTLAVAGLAWTIELTLCRRDDMGFQMLIGREALRRRFGVDPGRSYVSRDPGKPEPAHRTPKPATAETPTPGRAEPD